MVYTINHKFIGIFWEMGLLRISFITMFRYDLCTKIVFNTALCGAKGHFKQKLLNVLDRKAKSIT